MQKKAYAALGAMTLLFFIALFFSNAGCRVSGSSCISCHTDKQRLKEVADELEIPEDTGEG